jgi:hypothetical protein
MQLPSNLQGESLTRLLQSRRRENPELSDSEFQAVATVKVRF